MKILFVAPRFLPDLGGVERHVHHVCQNLIQGGKNVTIVTSTEDKHMQGRGVFENIPVYRNFVVRNRGPLQSVSNIIRFWIFFLKNLNLVRQHDIIHLHDYATFLWLLPILPLCTNRMFITFHGYESFPIPRSARILRRLAEWKAKGSICVGQFILKWYGSKPDFVTIGGTDSSPANTEAKSRDALFVGRLAEDTSIMQYLYALKILKSRGVSLPLHVCGDGPLLPNVKQFAEENGLDIYLHGFVDNTKDYLSNHFYVFATGYLSILEAMSCRRPVFAIYENPLKRDYLLSIPDCSELLFCVSSAEELANKLHDAIMNPKGLGEMLDKAHDFAVKQSWGNVADIYTRLYEMKLH